MQAVLNLRRIGGFKEQLERLDQILPGLLDGLALTGEVQFRAQRNIPVTFAFDEPREPVDLLHACFSFACQAIVCEKRPAR